MLRTGRTLQDLSIAFATAGVAALALIWLGVAGPVMVVLVATVLWLAARVLVRRGGERANRDRIAAEHQAHVAKLERELNKQNALANYVHTTQKAVLDAFSKEHGISSRP